MRSLAKPSDYGILNWAGKVTSIVSVGGSCLKYLCDGIIQKSSNPETFFSLTLPQLMMDKQKELILVDYVANWCCKHATHIPRPEMTSGY